MNFSGFEPHSVGITERQVPLDQILPTGHDCGTVGKVSMMVSMLDHTLPTGHDYGTVEKVSMMVSMLDHILPSAERDGQIHAALRRLGLGLDMYDFRKRGVWESNPVAFRARVRVRVRVTVGKT